MSDDFDESEIDTGQFLSHLFEQSVVIALRLGLDVETADAIADALVDDIADIWGGQQFYVGKGVTMKLRARDLQIYAEFSGNNHAQLAHKWGVSKVWVYAIVRRVTEAIAAKAKKGQQSLDIDSMGEMPPKPPTNT